VAAQSGGAIAGHPKLDLELFASSLGRNGGGAPVVERLAAAFSLDDARALHAAGWERAPCEMRSVRWIAAPGTADQVNLQLCK
jgi:hypothetical protein